MGSVNRGNGDSEDFEVELAAVFTMTMAKAVLEYQGELLFHGEAAFKDFFDRQFRCVWTFDGRANAFRLVRHEERPDPDKKS